MCMILLMILLSCKYSRGKGKADNGILDRPMVSYLFLAAVCALGCLSIKTDGAY